MSRDVLTHHLEQAWAASLNVPRDEMTRESYVIFKIGELIGGKRCDELVAEHVEDAVLCEECRVLVVLGVDAHECGDGVFCAADCPECNEGGQE